MTTQDPAETVRALNRAFGGTDDTPSFNASHEGDDFLFGRPPKPTTVTILTRVNDGDLHEIATFTPSLTTKPREGRHGQPLEQTESATARIQIDMAAALRACADEIDEMQGVTRGAQPLTTAQIEAGVAAAIATLEDRETGAGSDLGAAIYQKSDGVYVEIYGNVDLPQLVREIAEATR